MGRYLIRRILFGILVLWIVSAITFLIFVKLPAGDPARRVAGRQITAERLQNVREALGLDKPWYIQYGRFAKGLVPWPEWFLNEQAYFSYANQVPVKEELFRRLPTTAVLAAGGAAVFILIRVPIRVVAGIKSPAFAYP